MDSHVKSSEHRLLQDPPDRYLAGSWVTNMFFMLIGIYVCVLQFTCSCICIFEIELEISLAEQHGFTEAI